MILCLFRDASFCCGISIALHMNSSVREDKAHRNIRDGLVMRGLFKSESGRYGNAVVRHALKAYETTGIKRPCCMPPTPVIPCICGLAIIQLGSSWVACWRTDIGLSSSHYSSKEKPGRIWPGSSYRGFCSGLRERQKPIGDKGVPIDC